MSETAATPAAEPGPLVAPEVEKPGKRWLIVAGGSIPSNPGATVMVVEHWSDPKTTKGEDQVTHATEFLESEADEGKLKVDGYPRGADAYLKISPEVQFTAGDAPVYVLGENVLQSGIWGFERRKPGVCVGPAHPAYAGANIAAQHGATEIKIVGLSDAQKTLLAPYFDKLPSVNPKHFQSNVKVTLA